MRKEIDLTTWKGIKHYEWFRKYSEPTYTMTCDIDATKVYEYSKTHQLSFFITFLYLINKALNEIEEMRLRVEDDKVYIYDIIHPAYTVMTNDDIFDNCEHEYDDNFEVFYKRAKEAIEVAKKGVRQDKSYNDLNRYNQYYFTCLPWIKFTSLTHPLPHDNTFSVPRIAWGKFELVDGKYIMPLNICVSHSLVDGYPLAKAFNNVQYYLTNCQKWL